MTPRRVLGRQVASGIALVGALANAGCSATKNPASPSAPASGEVPVDFSGTWQGNYRVTTCLGDYHCVVFLGSDRPYRIALTQVGASVTGIFFSEGVGIDVVGTVDKDRNLRLQAAPIAVPTPGSEFTKFEALLTDANGALTGALQYTFGVRSSTEGPPGPVTRGGDILSAIRGMLTPRSSFAGVWRGYAFVRECTVSGSPYYRWEVGEARLFELRLQQSGDAVSGSLYVQPHMFPVTGSVSGGGLTLSGTWSATQSGITELERIVTWTTARDAVGRLSGEFTGVDEIRGADGREVSSSYRAELSDVLQVP
jgi:hypothetical protein